MVSIERGYDPREFALVAFGGAGGLHACELAEALSIPRVIVPALPGALSAFGILVSDVVKDYSRTVLWRVAKETAQRAHRARVRDPEPSRRKRVSRRKMERGDPPPAQRGRPLSGPGIRVEYSVHPECDSGFSRRAPAPLRLQLSYERSRTGDAAPAVHDQGNRHKPRGDGQRTPVQAGQSSGRCRRNTHRYSSPRKNSLPQSYPGICCSSAKNTPGLRWSRSTAQLQWYPPV